jgi:hypothetical protein
MQLDGEAVLLNLETHGYFGLNPTGTEVWELVQAHPGISATDIVAVMGRRYEQDPGRIVADIASVIGEMLRHGLVTACEPAGTPAVRVERCDRPYLVPDLQAYGDLDTLILSGE